MRRRERSRGPPHSRGCSLDGYDKVRAQPAVRQATPSPCPPRSCFEPRPDALSSQSQSFSRSYGSNLPTSLTYIVLSTRGCSPWRPAADIGTARHEIHVTPWGFQGAVEARRTPQEPRCFTEHVSLARIESISGSVFLTKKRELFPERPLPSPTSYALPHAVLENRSPCPGTGMLTRLPFDS